MVELVDRLLAWLSRAPEPLIHLGSRALAEDSLARGDRLATQLGAEKTLVQKSGYFARSAAANGDDLRLIKSMVDHAVECGLRGESGVIGHDEERGNRLRAIEFPRVKGGKPFNVDLPWFNDMLAEILQPRGQKIEVSHGGEKVPSIPPGA